MTLSVVSAAKQSIFDSKAQAQFQILTLNLLIRQFKGKLQKLIPYIREDSLDDKMNNFQKILKNNKQWSKQKITENKDYFKKHADSQSPKYLWIGCADSRIPAETILGLEPGEIFVHRNVANQVHASDVNTLSVTQFAVEVLKVQDIIITGHYNCGGVKAAMTKNDFGPLEAWLSHIRSTRINFSDKLNRSEEQNFNLLCELNVKAQVYEMAKIPSVQKAWARGQPLRIHGLIYRLDNGVLKDLGLTLDRLEQIPEVLWMHTPFEREEEERKENNESVFKKQPNRFGSSVSTTNDSTLIHDKEILSHFEGASPGEASCQLI